MAGLAGFVLAAAVVVGQAPEAEQHLKELKWLVGSWEFKGPLLDDGPLGNKGDETVLRGTHRWILNRKAIQFDWTMTVAGKQVDAGRALVGWDGTTNKIMEWAVTQDGNHFGEWRKDGDTWIYSMKGFGNAGAFSADLVYYDIGKDAFKFRLKNWTEGGKNYGETGEYVYRRVVTPRRGKATKKKDE